MIRLEVEGKALKLPDDVKITLSVNNPLFNDDDIIPGDYSIPFELISPEDDGDNAVALEHVDVIENQTVSRKRDCKIFFDDVLYKAGKLVNQEISGRVQSNFLGGFNAYPNLKTLKLRD